MISATFLTLLAGSVAAGLFTISNVPMLVRALRTRDLHSYSPVYLVLTNLGNVFYWVYVATLPVGPIWLMHGFYTLTAALMLVWYVRYRS
jgi:uncharacterized protein with PQ loop repeat